MAVASKKSIYSVHPGVLMTQKWITELKQKTGRSLEEWLAHIKKSGPKDEKERRAWLKEEFGLGTNTAWWLAERAEGKGEESGDPDLYLAGAERDVEKMFSGGKAKLRPLYDALLKLGLKTGKEAKACPCATIVLSRATMGRPASGQVVINSPPLETKPLPSPAMVDESRRVGLDAKGTIVDEQVFQNEVVVLGCRNGATCSGPSAR